MRTLTIWLIWLSPQQQEGRGQLQMSIWKHLTNLDTREQHSLCSYPKTDQTGIEPEQKVRV